MTKFSGETTQPFKDEAKALDYLTFGTENPLEDFRAVNIQIAKYYLADGDTRSAIFADLDRYADELYKYLPASDK